VESTFGVRQPEEVSAAKETGAPPYKGRGQPPKEGPAPLYTARELIEGLPEQAWQTVSWREGRQGDFEQANGGTASAPGDGKPSSQHRP
jgi:hypothetical protein